MRHVTRCIVSRSSRWRRIALNGDRKGQHLIAVNDQWRICFLTDTSRQFTTVGLRDVQPPADVAMPKQLDGTTAKGQYE